MNDPTSTQRIDLTLERSGISRRFLDRALSAMRWTILGTLLFITWLWPFTGRTGNALWIFILIFIAYNAVVELLRWRATAFKSYARIALLDLPVASILFFLDAAPGGPLFVLFYLGLISAALTMTARATIAYTLVIIVTVMSISPTLPGWEASADDLRQLSARLLTFALVGFGTALLGQRLFDEMRASRVIRDEAIRLGELARVREDFMASVSHEFQTPLTAIAAALGLLELRAAGRLDADERHLLDNARRNAERLGLLISDLLTYNLLGTGTIQLDRDRVDVGQICEGAITAVDLLFAEKGQILECHVPEQLSVIGDPRRLEQVLVNLLANANRHTPRGTRIAVVVNGSSGEVVITVRDNGPGIPPEVLPNIFERFHHRSDIGGGSGLGLTIAKGIIDLHEGRIWVESSPDGTAFHVALPAADNPEGDDTRCGA